MQLESRPIFYTATAWQDWLAAHPQRSAGPVTATSVFVVRPDGFTLAVESASDNAYMASGAVDAALALRQHADLVAALAEILPVKVFSGHADTPDAVFPNNVFASAPGRLLIGAMRHPVRRREAQRTDIPDWFVQQQGCIVERLDKPAVVAELTGVLVIDHARQVGYIGCSERVNAAGVQELHRAFGLRASFVFDLKPEEYHSNVVMSVLAGRVLLIHAGSFVDPAVPQAIAAAYGSQVLWLSDAEKAAFCGNCLALAEDQVWMSTRAAAALGPRHRQQLETAGFAIRAIDLSEIEKAGGSLRCCVAEVW